MGLSMGNYIEELHVSDRSHCICAATRHLDSTTCCTSSSLSGSARLGAFGAGASATVGVALGRFRTAWPRC